MSEPKEPTIVFLFDVKNWFEKINPISKIDLIDIATFVSTQFYMDFTINAYVLILTKSKWDTLSSDLKTKFMFISRRLKEEMEGPMVSSERTLYEQGDIFEILMNQPKQTTIDTETLDKLEHFDLNTINEEDETSALLNAIS